jgi:4-hydroxy-tetrahydrodipicolinate reductase
MNIALIGYGKMGKEIDRLASERNIAVLARLEPGSEMKESEIRRTDVLIHFASPESVLPYVQQWATAKKNIVVGTTGWQKDLDRVKSIVAETKIGLVYASNFSVGVHLFFRLVKEAATLMNNFAEYDVTVHEAHHKDKVDSPSGTALTAARILLEGIHRKKTILSDTFHGKIKPDQLQVTSTRVGAIVGTHTIIFDSLADSIELKHTAKNRSGFALGAILAAEWVKDKHGLYTMEDVLADIIR